MTFQTIIEPDKRALCIKPFRYYWMNTINDGQQRDVWLISCRGVTLAQLVKASVGQADVQRFDSHLGHNWLSFGVFLVKSRHFGLPLAQTIRPNWQSLLACGSVAIQTWSRPIYKVYT